MKPLDNTTLVWFSPGSLDAVALWRSMLGRLHEAGIAEGPYSYMDSGRTEDDWRRMRLRLNDVEEFLAQQKGRMLTSFQVFPPVVLAPFSTMVVPLNRPGRACQVSCSVKEGAWNPGAAMRLVDALSVQGEMRIACAYSHGLYGAWQRCRDANEYGRYGSTEGLSIREYNPGLPPPLDKEIRREIDTSRNPGRMGGTLDEPRFVMADLWLGPGFWSYAPCTKEEVLAADFFLEVRDTPHYLYLKSWPHPFTRPDGEQGRVQQKLWRLLFHEDCEWPPGSGGISDTPVGGPPELMP
jgi:hypothetical protein